MSSNSHPVAEPHLSSGYLAAGGTLPSAWRGLARLIDLTALCESLTHDHLPGQIASELVELVRATVEHRDPQLDWRHGRKLLFGQFGDSGSAPR